MPDYTDYRIVDWRDKKKLDAIKQKKHSELEAAWRNGELSWNEYIRQEKKYRI